MSKDLNNIYNYLKANTADMPEYDIFAQDMQDERFRHNIYKAISERVELPAEDEWYAEYGYGKRRDVKKASKAEAEDNLNAMRESGLVEQAKEMKKEYGQQKRQARRDMLMQGLATMPTQGMPQEVKQQNAEAIYNNEDYEQTAQEYAQAKLAHGSLRDAIREERSVGRWFLDDMWAKTAETVTDLSNWDFGISDMVDAATLSTLAEKAESGTLTASEDRILDAVALAQAIQGNASKLDTGARDVIGGALESFGFMAQMAANPASGAAKALGKRAIRKYGADAIEMTTRELVVNHGGKALAKKVGAELAGGAGEAAAFAVSTGAMRTAADAINRQTGTIQSYIDNNGFIQNAGFTEGDDTTEAILKAFGNTFIEGYTEQLGGALIDPLFGLMRGATKGGVKTSLGELKQGLLEIKGKELSNAITKLKSDLKWDGFVSEALEEEIGMISQGLFGIEDNLSRYNEDGTINENWMFGARNLVTMLLSTALMTGSFEAAEKVGNIYFAKQLNRYLSTAESDGAKAWGESWGAIKEVVDQLGVDEIARYINDMASDPAVTNERLAAMANYAITLVRYQQYNIATEREQDELAEIQRNAMTAYNAGRQMHIANFRSVQQRADKAYDALANRDADLLKRADEWLEQQKQTGKLPVAEIETIRNGLSADVSTLLDEYIGAMTARQGIYDKIDDTAYSQMDVFERDLAPVIRDGAVTTATLDGKPVYVLSQENGSAVILSEDAETEHEGKGMMVDASRLKDISTIDAKQLVDAYRYRYATDEQTKADMALNHHRNTQMPTVGMQIDTPSAVEGGATTFIVTNVQPQMGYVELVPGEYDAEQGKVMPKNGAEPIYQTVYSTLQMQDEMYDALDAMYDALDAMNGVQSVQVESGIIEDNEQTEEDAPVVVPAEEEVAPTEEEVATQEEEVATEETTPEERTQAEIDADDAAELAELGDNDYISSNLDKAKKVLDKAKEKKPKATEKEARLAEARTIKAEVDAAQAEVERWTAAQREVARRALQATQEVATPSAQIEGVESLSPDAEKTEENTYKLSNEVDENGRQFVLSSKGELEFGLIEAESGLQSAPILLSEGMITNPVTNDGYGLVHIEARHGAQIREAGYSSVVEFIEEVARNYEVIREGKLRDGNQTYMLQLTDKHNNTLMVELSGDGTYWNINTAGIFKTSYGRNRNVVYSRHTTDNQSVETDGESQDNKQSDTMSSSSMNSPTSTEGKDTNTSETSNTEEEKNKEKNTTLAKPKGKKETQKKPSTPTHRRDRYADELNAMGEYLNFRDFVLRYFAGGGRLAWTDNGPIKGLASHLGLKRSRKEYNKRIWLIASNAMHPERAAEELRLLYAQEVAPWIEDLEEVIPIDEAFNEMMDVLQSHDKPSSMLAELREMHSRGSEYDQAQEEYYRQEAFYDAYHMSEEEYADYNAAIEEIYAEDETIAADREKYFDEVRAEETEQINNIDNGRSEKTGDNSVDERVPERQRQRTNPQGSNEVLSETQPNSENGDRQRADARTEVGINEESSDNLSTQSADRRSRADGQSGKTETAAERRAKYGITAKEDARREPLRERAREVAEKLGTNINVIEDKSEVTNEDAKKQMRQHKNSIVKGWFENSTGELFIVLPSMDDMADLEATILHELVAHKGLRNLLGARKFNQLCDAVWEMMTPEQQQEWLAYPGVNGSKRAAADEYIASLAEKMDLSEVEQTTWNKIKQFVLDVLQKLGFRDITENDIQDLIRASYAYMRAGNTNEQTTNEGNRYKVYRSRDGKEVGYTQLSQLSLQFDWGERERDTVSGRNTDVLQREDDATLTTLNTNRQLEEGEVCNVERIFTESKGFDFTSGEKIESAADVAYIFKNLEDEAIENVFVALVKDGKPTVIHVGMGGQAYSLADNSAVVAAANRINPDKVYLVHNHPSGSLRCSPQDRSMLKSVKDALGDVVQDGIIINTRSGKFGVFSESMFGTDGTSDMPENKEDSPLKVYKFNKQAFKSNVVTVEASPYSIAEFISTQRLGSRNKINALLLNNQFGCVGNVFLTETEVNDTNRDSIAQRLVDDAVAMNAKNIVIYGNYPLVSVAVESNIQLREAIEKASGKTVELKDVIEINGSTFPPSALNYGVRFRTTIAPDVREEMESIKADAIANGTFLKAPNGKDTNLNEEQWLMVRTNNFKKWFGDWMKAARIEKLRKSKAIDVNYNNEYELNRESAKSWMKDNLRGEYTNADTGEVVSVTKVGSNKVTSHGERDEAHLKSIIAIPSLIENSIFIEEQKNEKDNDKYDSYRYYVCGAKIDGEDYTVKIVIGVKGDSKYYDHRLTQIEKGTLIDNLNGMANPVAENQNANNSIGKDSKLISILQTNSSKIVDENGEPMVVYHGTDSEFTSFEMQDGSIGRGAYFTSNWDEAAQYAMEKQGVENINELDESKIKEVFLNVRDERNITHSRFSRGDIEVLATSPNQIKSATDNNGEFGESNDIRFRTLEERKALRDSEESKIIFDTAKEKFGTTYDLREAGYILPDGTMLDFSGRHEIRGADTSFLAGDRTVDHRAIQEIEYDFDENETGVKTDMGDFLDRGAVRIDVGAGAINLNIPPTSKQKNILRRLIERNDGYVYVDFGNGWDTEHYAEYEDTTSRRILNDIDRYYSEGIKPTGDIRFRIANENQEIFVSNAQRAVESIKQDKATPEQWLAMITKQGGLKAGEDKWLGLSDWLKGMDQKPVTKQEILNFIGENKIRIEEVHYASRRVFNDEGKVESDAPINSTRLQYTTAGLDNNREIALVVPSVESWNKSDEVHFGDAGEGRAIAWVRFGETTAYDESKELKDTKKALEELAEKYDGQLVRNPNITKEDEKLAKELNKKIRELLLEGEAGDRRVLVIDEIQSKRHQEGREKGYKSNDAIAEEERLNDAVVNAQDAYDSYTRRMGDKYNGAYEDIYGTMTEAEQREADRLEQEVYAASERYNNHQVPDIPDAPFDKNWHELAMKRMLRLAAEEGYDYVAWTTGAQQAERYNLGSRVDEIKVVDGYDGVFTVIGRKDGGILLQEDVEGEQGLAELLGTGLARKAYSNLKEGKDDYLNEDGAVSFTGESLVIGGEGMKGFYDKMLPSFVSKYTKKWGAKVEDIELPQLEESARVMHSVNITPEMKESVMQGQTMFRIKEVNDKFNSELETLNEENADKVVLNVGNPSPVLLSAGVEDRPMKLYGNKIIKKVKKHGLKIQDLKNLPSAVADPIAVFDNYKQEGNRSILTELRVADGNILATIDLGKGMDVDFNIVSSTFGKSDNKIVAWINKGFATYINKEKALDYLHLSAPIAEASDKKELSSATNIVEMFENPTIGSENSEVSEDRTMFSVKQRTEADYQDIENRLGIAAAEYERRMDMASVHHMEAWQDSMRSLLEMQRAIEKETGKPILDYENAYMAENRMSSENLAQMEEWKRKFFRPLEDIYKGFIDRGENQFSIRDYLFAKHGMERNAVMARREAQRLYPNDPLQQIAKESDLKRTKDYSGLKKLMGKDNIPDAIAEAQKYVQDFEKKHKAEIAKLWDAIRNATHSQLEVQRASGLLTQEKYEEIKNMYNYYVPLRGFSETTTDEVYDYLDNAPTPYNVPIKTAKGRESVGDDPIANIANMADSGIMQANRNKMKLHFLNMAERHKTNLVTVSEVIYKYNPVAKMWEPTLPALSPNDTIEETLAKIRQHRANVAKEMVLNPQDYKTEANLKKMGRDIPYKVINKAMLSEHQVLVMREGKQMVMTINGNPRAAQALNGLTNPEVKAEEQRWIQKANRFMAANFTSRNPAFVISNLSRDSIYAVSMVWAKEAPKYARAFMNNMGKVFANMASLMRKYNNGTLDTNVPMEKMFLEFVMNGGQTGYTHLNSVEDYKRQMAKEMKRAAQHKGVRAVTETGRAILNGLESMNKWAENISRFTAYVTSREEGRSISRSISDAKEISVNFNKKGAGNSVAGKFEKGNRLNYLSSQAAQLARGLYVFMNAGIQGMANFAKQAKRHPYKITAMIASSMALGLAAALLGGGGDDEEEYLSLPKYTRRNNLCIKVGDKFVTIPLPIELRAFYGIGELIASRTALGEYYSDAEFAKEFAEQLSQLLPIDVLEGGEGFNIKSFIPSAAKPIVDAILNESWTGIPIYNDSEFVKTYPGWKKAYKGTNDMLVDVSRWLNEMSGGSDYKQGWMDINPAAIEYIAEQYLGGVGTTVNQFFKMGQTATGAMEFEWRNVPVASRFVNSGNETTQIRAIRNSYYDYREEMDAVGKEFNAYMRDLKKPGLKEEEYQRIEQEIDRIVNSPEYDFYLWWKDINKVINRAKDAGDTEGADELMREAVETYRSWKKGLE